MSREGNASRLREIERRLTDVMLTPTPWSADGAKGVRRAGYIIFASTVGTSFADAEFAAHARDDVPWLLARVKQLEAHLEAAHPDWIVLALDPLTDEDG